MCIAEGEGSRFSALLNSAYLNFRYLQIWLRKSGYIKLTEICLYFCHYHKTLILIGLNTFPDISFRNGQVFREVSCNLFLQTDSIFPNNDFFLNANSNYFDIFAENKVIMPQSAITIRLDSDLKKQVVRLSARCDKPQRRPGFKTCRLTRFCKDFV